MGVNTIASVDPVYGVNHFNQTKVLSESETLINNILMILFGKPGFYPSIPYLGMDIEGYLYMLEDEVNPVEIKAQLASQCREFLPNIKDGSMNVYTANYKDHLMLIFELPILIDAVETVLSLGVTVNEKGEMVYTFVANDEVQTI
jgi:hypothetical protein